MTKLKFNHGIVEDFTYILSTRDFRHIGQLVGFTGARVAVHENSANELSLAVSKIGLLKIHGTSIIDLELYKKIRQYIWDQIVDFKLLYVKELDEYFEIKVSTNDSSAVTKTITGTSLCETELSNLRITAEINTESDLKLNEDKATGEYLHTVFYNEENTNLSLLHRILKDKAPHYSIGYVDDSLKNIQRTFSISNQSIYDFLIGECSEQINCIFKFNSSKREINVYDLFTVCLEEGCGHRGDFYDVCPKCGSTKLKYYGTDTTIFIDKNNLTDAIRLECNTGNVKNCFKLEAGDEKITLAVRDINPNGSDYIYYRTEYQSQDMPQKLIDKWEDYNKLYRSVLEKNINETEIYNMLTEESKQLLYPANTSIDIKKYQDITNKIDSSNERIYYLEHSMMPTLEIGNITASDEAAKLKTQPTNAVPVGLSPLGLSSLYESMSLDTINEHVLNYAKIFVKTGYVKLEVDMDNINGIPPVWTIWSTTETQSDQTKKKVFHGLWKGRIKITSYSDETDIAYSDLLEIEVNTNRLNFIEQKILKTLNKDEEEGSIFDVLAIDGIDSFKSALKQYSKARLDSFYQAIEAAMGILLNEKSSEIGQAVYNNLYPDYAAKYEACDAELIIRRKEIQEQKDIFNQYSKLRTEIHNLLNFERYLGEELYKIFCAYRREDVYSNANYISDGLDSVSINQKAKDFLALAEQELYKSAEQQISVTSDLYNLLLLKEFEPIVHYFECGNWIHLKIDGVHYKLRLLGYTINFDSTQTLEVEFSNATKTRNLINDAQQIMSSAKSMSASYGHVSLQASQGSAANNSISDWVDDGLNASLIQLQNNENQDIIITKNGLLARMYDEETGMYDPRQLRIIYNTIAFTNDNWKTVSQAVGEHSYTFYNEGTNEMLTRTGYGVTAEHLTSEYINGKTIIGGIIYSSNYSNGTNGKNPEGTYIDLINGNLSLAGGKLYYDSKTNRLSVVSDDLDQNIIDLLETMGITPDALTVQATNIIGTLGYHQISSVKDSAIVTDIEGTLTSGISSDYLVGTIPTDLIPKITADKIDDIIPLNKIATISFSDINGILSSNRITNELNNKTFVDCTWSGSLSVGNKSRSYTEITSNGVLNSTTAYIDWLQVNGISTLDDYGDSYTGVTGNYEIGDKVLSIVNGIIVDVLDVDYNIEKK